MDTLTQLLQPIYECSSYVLLAGILAILITGFFGLPFVAWVLSLTIVLLGFHASPLCILIFWGLSLLFIIPPVRRTLVSNLVMKVMKGILPKISDTELEAIEAGSVWIEGQLFAGYPKFKKIFKENPYPKLTAEEQAFLDGPVEELCKAVNDWEVWQKREIPKEAWDIIKKEKFFGMIIPKEYGGLGFSALAHGAVISKLTSRCIPLAVTVMVPNSLGPAELLYHYGTDEQKKTLLPKLATGEEIPCFGLTEPTAGSDAGSVLSYGELYKDAQGELRIRLNWNKRWITLAAISTLIGLAFRLRDPENLLGKGEDLGITCALIPAKTPGVVVGRRHDPLGVPFYNCPTQGNDVDVSIDTVVGGLSGVGKGWSMLMACLAAGRGISLPSQAVGGAQTLTRIVSAHSAIRMQFGVPIASFEGVEEPLARIFSYNYILEACRNYTCGSIDAGNKPAVVTAMCKYHSTEMGRIAVNDAMDVMGGTGISCGPRNTVAHAYIANPIGITVEGANILTRTLMIFGQGLLRAHPFVFQEVMAATNGDLKAFDRAFWAHVGSVVRNMFRSFLLSITRGYLASRGPGGALGRYYQKLSWASASFGLLTDISMGTQGGSLKFKGKLTGRFADILSWMYLATCILRRYEGEGRREEDLVIVRYSLDYAFAQIQKGFSGLFFNLSVPGFSWVFRLFGLWSEINPIGTPPSDRRGHELVRAFVKPSEFRDRHTQGAYITDDTQEPMGRLDYTLTKITEAREIERKIKKAIRAKTLPKGPLASLVDEAVSKGVISSDEKEILLLAESLRWDAIQVDDFDDDEYKAHTIKSKVTGLEPNLTKHHP
ncbi:MAG: acyl-CoA dehydrogenase [Bdellovibrionaceae bacterium]|nr:acyl-CoA dehydrogenase [Pseudobdellovibrionaceae bacterium]